jgi:hypothetical protein
MAIATVFSGVVCFAGAAHSVDEYCRGVPHGLPLIAHVKGIPLHVLSFIYPALGMYLSVMVLLLWWYFSVRPARLPGEPNCQECRED